MYNSLLAAGQSIFNTLFSFGTCLISDLCKEVRVRGTERPTDYGSNDYHSEIKSDHSNKLPTFGTQVIERDFVSETNDVKAAFKYNPHKSYSTGSFDGEYIIIQNPPFFLPDPPETAVPEQTAVSGGNFSNQNDDGFWF
jgi:hypothetical protein